MTTLVATAKHAIHRRWALGVLLVATVAAVVLSLTLAASSGGTGSGGAGSSGGTTGSTTGSTDTGLRSPSNPCHVVARGFC